MNKGTFTWVLIALIFVAIVGLAFFYFTPKNYDAYFLNIGSQIADTNATRYYSLEEQQRASVRYIEPTSKQVDLKRYYDNTLDVIDKNDLLSNNYYTTILTTDNNLTISAICGTGYVLQKIDANGIGTCVSNGVPYTGATTSLNLGIWNLDTTGDITSTRTTSQFFQIPTPEGTKYITYNGLGGYFTFDDTINNRDGGMGDGNLITNCLILQDGNTFCGKNDMGSSSQIFIDTNEATAGRVNASGVRLVDFNFGGKSLFNAQDLNATRLFQNGVQACDKSNNCNYQPNGFVQPIDNFTIKRQLDGNLKVADRIENNILENSFRLATLQGQSAFLMNDAFTDTYNDQNYISTTQSINQTYDATNKLYSNYSAGSFIPESNLVTHYKLNDNASNTTVVDSINGINGTSAQNTSVLTTTGKINSALSFNGSGDLVTIPQNTLINTPATAWSINAWAYTTKSANANYDGIVSGIYAGAGKVKLYLGMGDPISGASHKISAGFYNAGWISVQSPNTFPTSTWVMETVTYDGHYLRIYENSTLAVTSTDLSRSLPSDADGWIIGRGWDGSNWQGKIDDVRMYSKVLSQTDINYLYNSGAGTEAEGSGGASGTTNMTLISSTLTATGTPRNIRAVVYEQDLNSSAPIRLNQDLNLYASRDNNKTWTQISLTDDGNYQSGQRILTGITNLTTNDANANIKYKLVTDNNRPLNIHGLSLAWDSNNDPNTLYTPAPPYTDTQLLTGLENIFANQNGNIEESSFPKWVQKPLQNYNPLTKRYEDSNDLGIDQKKLNLLQIFVLKAVYQKAKDEITNLYSKIATLQTQLDGNATAFKNYKTAVYNCANNNKTNFTNYNTCVRALGN